MRPVVGLIVSKIISSLNGDVLRLPLPSSNHIFTVLIPWVHDSEMGFVVANVCQLEQDVEVLIHIFDTPLPSAAWMVRVAVFVLINGALLLIEIEPVGGVLSISDNVNDAVIPDEVIFAPLTAQTR